MTPFSLGMVKHLLIVWLFSEDDKKTITLNIPRFKYLSTICNTEKDQQESKTMSLPEAMP